MSNESLECYLAQTPEQRAQVYRLRYACYRRRNAIELRQDQQFSDEFDTKPNNLSFLVQAGSAEPFATVRITVVRPDLGWDDSPGRHVYGDHPSFESIRRESYVEASRLCFECQARRDTFVRLLGNMAALAEFYEVGWLVACPRVEHSLVYQRLFGFRPLAEARRYFGVNFQTQLLGVRTSEIRSYVVDQRLMNLAWSQALTQLQRDSNLCTMEQ